MRLGSISSSRSGGQKHFGSQRRFLEPRAKLGSVRNVPHDFQVRVDFISKSREPPFGTGPCLHVNRSVSGLSPIPLPFVMGVPRIGGPITCRGTLGTAWSPGLSDKTETRCERGNSLSLNYRLSNKNILLLMAELQSVIRYLSRFAACHDRARMRGREHLAHTWRCLVGHAVKHTTRPRASSAAVRLA